jgi:Ca2+/H+ antiporter, TMEM165/GDT1 family
MGDETRIATVALAARFDVLAAVVVMTLAMMFANVPAVHAGDAITRRVPLRLVRAIPPAFLRCQAF